VQVELQKEGGRKKPLKYSQDYNKNDSNYEVEKYYKGFVDEITFFTA